MSENEAENARRAMAARYMHPGEKPFLTEAPARWRPKLPRRSVCLLIGHTWTVYLWRDEQRDVVCARCRLKITQTKGETAPSRWHYTWFKR